MHKLKTFQNYFTILYVLGLNPFISFANINKKRSKIISFFLRSLNILVSLLVVFLTNVKWQNSKWLIVFGHLTYSYDVCINFIAVFENLTNLNATYRILKTLSIVIEMFVTTFGANFPYTAVKKSIKWKFLIIMLAVFLNLIGHLGNNKQKIIENILWTYFNTITSVHYMHLLFYIEFMKFILIGLSEKIVSMTCQTRVYWRCERTKEWLNLIHQIKLIHFKLWRVAHTVNSLFGWFMLSFMMEQATKFIFYAYYIFTSASKWDGKVIFIIRKYLFFNHFCTRFIQLFVFYSHMH